MSYFHAAVSDLILQRDNPRFEEAVLTEDEAIMLLMEEEGLVSTLKDIVSLNSLNPLDVPGVIAANNGKFVVVEGNRRVACLKLLNGLLSPPEPIESVVKALTKQWIKIEQVFVYEFEKKKDAEPWIERLHSGFNNGKGRKEWDAEQKQRHFNPAKNKLGQDFLNYCRENELLTASERRRKITSVQRLLQKKDVKQLFKIEKSADGGLKILPPEERFKRIAAGIAEDLKSDVQFSRMNAVEAKQYAEDLLRRLELTDQSSSDSADEQ